MVQASRLHHEFPQVSRRAGIINTWHSRPQTKWWTGRRCWRIGIAVGKTGVSSSGRTVVSTSCTSAICTACRRCGTFGDVLVVGVNSDASVRDLKGPGRPIVLAGERAELLAALECVDRVVLFDETTPEIALARLQPDVHCKGADYAGPSGKPIPEADVVQAYGGRVEFLPLVPDVSTSDIIRRIREG